MTFAWTAINKQHVRDMWSKGLSANKIAAAIGNPSRNSVMGMIHRMDLESRPSPIKRAMEPKPRGGAAGLKAARAKTQPRQRDLFATDTARAHPAPNAQPRGVPSVPAVRAVSETSRQQRTPWTGQPVKFADLKPGRCQWIEGPTVRFHAHESMACGAPVELGCSWCAVHRRRAWTGRLEVKPRAEMAGRGG